MGMSDDDILTFDEAVDLDASHDGERSVLLGNGFSIDWNPALFSYTSLFDEAALADLDVDKATLFDTLDTRDFESVIDYLRTAAKLVQLYGSDDGLSDQFLADAEVIRDGLADVIADRHPLTALAIDDNEAELARCFLANFDSIFTLNYDLLLYWVLNRQHLAACSPPRRDGFEYPTLHDTSRLVWKRSAAERGQHVFYVHGALHLFVEKKKLTKLRYGLAEPLIDQIRERLLTGQYPLIVTEGRSEAKEARISRSAYLRFASQTLEDLDGSLFVHGAALSSSDGHITRLLESKDSRIESLYVGLHEPDGDSAAELEATVRRIKRHRKTNGGKTLDIAFYDSASAHVWR